MSQPGGRVCGAEPFVHATRCVGFQQGSRAVLCCGDDGLLRRWGEKRDIWEELLFTKNEKLEGFAQPHGSPNQVLLCTVSGSLFLHDLRQKKESMRFDASDGRVYGIDAHPSRPERIMTNSVTGEACIWDLRQVTKSKPKALYTMLHARAACSAVFSPNGGRALTSSWDDTVKLWDVNGAAAQHLSTWRHYNQTGLYLTKLTARFVPGSESVALIGNRGQGFGSMAKGSVDVYDFEKKTHYNMDPHNDEVATVVSLVEMHRTLPLMVSSFSTGCVAQWQ